MATIEIQELTNTWGCAWREIGGEMQYDFRAIPASNHSRNWLAATGGDAVWQILKARLGTIVETVPGGYGGECHTIRVDTDILDNATEAFWNRKNAAERKQRKRSSVCHYCGMPVANTGFFGESVCSDCR